MILVKLGTQKQEFKRLLDYIEKSNIKDEIIVQAGCTKYKSNKMAIYDFVEYDKMQKYTKKADVIITHGGTGSIVESIQIGKKVIACARKQENGEHADNHQEEIVSTFAKAGYILELNENNNLDDLINQMKTFKPKKFISNTEKFKEKLKKEIGD